MQFKHVVGLLQVLVFFFTMNDPFFGDAISTVSRAALHIYDQNLLTIWYLPQNDPGHPTLFPYLLALLWKVFGKHLWVGHFLTTLFAIGITYQVDRLASRYLPAKQRMWLLILLLVQPGFIAQSAMVLTHLPLCFFFLAALNALLFNQRMAFYLASVLMVFTHLEGVFLLAGLGLGYFYQLSDKEKFVQRVQSSLAMFVPCLIATAAWGWAHAQHTGWWFSSPVYAEHRNWMGLTPMLKSFILIVWRILDYGNITFYLILIWGVWKKQYFRHELFHYLLATILTCSLVFAVFMSKSIAHRYFLPMHLPALILAVMAINQLAQSARNLLITLCFVSLLAGNFLHYPGKCIGDATLAYREYFTLAEKIRKDTGGHIVFYTYPPLSNDEMVTSLNEMEMLKVEKLYGTSIQQVPAVLQSNCNCEFSKAELNELSGWKGKSFEQQVVYVNVLFNPRFYPQPPFDEPLRTKSSMELWMERVKEKK